MTRSRHLAQLLGLTLLTLGMWACGGDSGENENRGVDLENKVVRVGLLNDLSGPAAAIGRPIQLGFEIFYQQVNAGESGILPEGWTIDWEVRDHGYNPQQSVQMYNELRDNVLFLGMSFGTPTTLPLQPMLSRDHMMAVAASLSSRTGVNQFTPVVTPTYRTEAMRAVDWAVERSGTSLKLGIVYQQDDFGEDSLEGLELEAEFHGVQIVARQAISPGQADFTAVVSSLVAAGAEYVMVGTLPSATGPLLGTAAQLGYSPIWIGNGPSWIDRFFDPDVIPAEVFENFHLSSVVPFWDDDNPGMEIFRAAYDRFGRSEMEPDSYIISGYMYAAAGIEALRLAIEAGDVSPEGVMAGLRRIDGWDLRGITPPISMVDLPYDAGRLTRVSRPVMADRRWEVLSDFAAPLSDGR